MKKRHVVGTRPTQTPLGKDIPLDTPIYNASRPLLGNPCWVSDFRHGIYYSVVTDPDETYAAQRIALNERLDAVELVWHKEEELIEAATHRIIEKYGEKKFNKSINVGSESGRGYLVSFQLSWLNKAGE